MTDSSRQLVQKGIDQAYKAALPLLHARLDLLPEEVQNLALQSAEGLRLCLLGQAEAVVPNAEFQDSLIRLIFGHGDPRIVGALRDFLETLNIYLREVRTSLVSEGHRKDS